MGVIMVEWGGLQSDTPILADLITIAADPWLSFYSDHHELNPFNSHSRRQ